MLSRDHVDSSGITLYYSGRDDTSSTAANVKSTTPAPSSDGVDSSGVTLDYNGGVDTSSMSADVKSTSSALLIITATLHFFARIVVN